MDSEMILAQARAARRKIEQATRYVPDEAGAGYTSFFPAWQVGQAYPAGDRFRWEGNLYKVLQEHTSQGDWPPDKAVSLYVRIADPAEEWPEWVQPLGAHAGKLSSPNEFPLPQLIRRLREIEAAFVVSDCKMPTFH